jgi:hypothetical protein
VGVLLFLLLGGGVGAAALLIKGWPGGRPLAWVWGIAAGAALGWAVVPAPTGSPSPRRAAKLPPARPQTGRPGQPETRTEPLPVGAAADVPLRDLRTGRELRLSALQGRRWTVLLLSSFT